MNKALLERLCNYEKKNKIKRKLQKTNFVKTTQIKTYTILNNVAYAMNITNELSKCEKEALFPIYF